MSLMGLFKRSKGGPHVESPFHGPVDPNWARGPEGRYRKLALIDTDSEDLRSGGVFVIWHGGVRPKWIWIGVTSDIGQALEQCQGDKDITQYEVHGGLFATWSPVLQAYRAGVAKYLQDAMDPLIKNPQIGVDDRIEPIEVLLPGTKK